MWLLIESNSEFNSSVDSLILIKNITRKSETGVFIEFIFNQQEMILVLYTFEDKLQASSLIQRNPKLFPNAIEIPLYEKIDTITLGDLLSYFPECLHNFTFFVEWNGKYLHLPAMSSMVPISNANIINLKMAKSLIPPCVPQTQLEHYFNQSKNKIIQSNKEANNKRTQSSINEINLQAFVGEDTAASLAEAAETAKNVATAAAKSLFSFASSMGKSVLDVAGNVAASSSSSSLVAGTSVTLSSARVTVTRQLSEGGFGVVYAVRDDATGSMLALKQLLCQNKEQVVEAQHEVDVLLALRGHDHIVSLLDHSSAQLSATASTTALRQILLLFPMYPRGTAWDEIERAMGAPSWPFPEAQALRITLQMADALQFMHDRGFAHRDVKPHNILLDTQNNAVLMDLGSAAAARASLANRQDCLLLEDDAARKTTAAYRAPELFTAPFPPCEIDERVDVWALGCTSFALAFGRSPFDLAKEGVSKLAVMNGKYTVPNHACNRDCQFSNAFLQMVADMLQVDMTRRPYMHELIEQYRQI